MKKLVLITATMAWALSCQASEELASASNCLACHKADAQLVGPSYQDIAAKYKDQEGASDALFESIKNGSSGTWGAVPMPPNAAVSDEDIQALVDWILAM